MADWQYAPFLNYEQVSRWQCFASISSWEVSGSVPIHHGECRLFDIPIADGFLTPRYRMRELVYTRMLAGDANGGRADNEVVKIGRGWLFATDRRFIAYNDSTGQKDDIPYSRILEVEYKNGDFYLTVDQNGIIRDRLSSRPAPPRAPWQSEREYAAQVLVPAYVQASNHVVSEVLIRMEFPKSGLIDALTIIGAPSNAERLWYSDLVRKKNEDSADFLSTFYTFLSELVER